MSQLKQKHLKTQSASLEKHLFHDAPLHNKTSRLKECVELTFENKFTRWKLANDYLTDYLSGAPENSDD